MSIAPSRARLERGAASSSHAFGGTAAPRHAVLFRNIVLAARWTVYTLTKDNNGFRRLTFVGLFVDFVQMLGFLLSPAVPWGLDNFQAVITGVTLDATALSFDAFAFIFAMVVFLALLMLALAGLVGYQMLKSHGIASSLNAVRLLRILIAFFVTILFVPVSKLLFAVFPCDDDDDSKWWQAYPERACGSDAHLILSIVSAITLSLFLPFALTVALLVFQWDPRAESPLGEPHNRHTVIYLLGRILLTAVILAESPTATVLVFSAVTATMTALTLLAPPYYRERSNVWRTGEFSGLTLAGLWTLIHVQTPSMHGSAWSFALLFVLLLVGGGVGALLQRLRFRALAYWAFGGRRAADAVVALHEEGEASVGAPPAWLLCNGFGSVEIVTRFLQTHREPAHVVMANGLYLDAIERRPKSARLRAAYIIFLISYAMRDRTTGAPPVITNALEMARKQMEETRLLTPLPDTSYILFTIRRGIEERMQSSAHGSHGGTLSAMDFAFLRKYEKRAEVHSKATLQWISRFWAAVALGYTDDKVLQGIAEAISEHEDHAFESFEELLRRFPTSVTVLRNYAAFLLTCARDEEGGHWALRRADELEEKRSTPSVKAVKKAPPLHTVVSDPLATNESPTAAAHKYLKDTAAPTDAPPAPKMAATVGEKDPLPPLRDSSVTSPSILALPGSIAEDGAETALDGVEEQGAAQRLAEKLQEERKRANPRGLVVTVSSEPPRTDGAAAATPSSALAPTPSGNSLGVPANRTGTMSEVSGTNETSLDGFLEGTNSSRTLTLREMSPSSVRLIRGLWLLICLMLFIVAPLFAALYSVELDLLLKAVDHGLDGTRDQGLHALAIDTWRFQRITNGEDPLFEDAFDVEAFLTSMSDNLDTLSVVLPEWRVREVKIWTDYADDVSVPRTQFFSELPEWAEGSITEQRGPPPTAAEADSLSRAASRFLQGASAAGLKVTDGAESRLAEMLLAASRAGERLRQSGNTTTTTTSSRPTAAYSAEVDLSMIEADIWVVMTSVFIEAVTYLNSYSEAWPIDESYLLINLNAVSGALSNALAAARLLAYEHVTATRHIFTTSLLTAAGVCVSLFCLVFIYIGVQWLRVRRETQAIWLARTIPVDVAAAQLYALHGHETDETDQLDEAEALSSSEVDNGGTQIPEPVTYLDSKLRRAVRESRNSSRTLDEKIIVVIVASVLTAAAILTGFLAVNTNFSGLREGVRVTKMTHSINQMEQLCGTMLTNSSFFAASRDEMEEQFDELHTSIFYGIQEIINGRLDENGNHVAPIVNTDETRQWLEDIGGEDVMYGWINQAQDLRELGVDPSAYEEDRIKLVSQSFRMVNSEMWDLIHILDRASVASSQTRGNLARAVTGATVVVCVLLLLTFYVYRMPRKLLADVRLARRLLETIPPDYMADPRFVPIRSFVKDHHIVSRAVLDDIENVDGNVELALGARKSQKRRAKKAKKKARKRRSRRRRGDDSSSSDDSDSSDHAPVAVTTSLIGKRGFITVDNNAMLISMDKIGRDMLEATLGPEMVHEGETIVTFPALHRSLQSFTLPPHGARRPIDVKAMRIGNNRESALYSCQLITWDDQMVKNAAKQAMQSRAGLSVPMGLTADVLGSARLSANGTLIATARTGSVYNQQQHRRSGTEMTERADSTRAPASAVVLVNADWDILSVAPQAAKVLGCTSGEKQADSRPPLSELLDLSATRLEDVSVGDVVTTTLRASGAKVRLQAVEQRETGILFAVRVAGAAAAAVNAGARTTTAAPGSKRATLLRQDSVTSWAASQAGTIQSPL